MFLLLFIILCSKASPPSPPKKNIAIASCLCYFWVLVLKHNSFNILKLWQVLRPNITTLMILCNVSARLEDRGTEALAG